MDDERKKFDRKGGARKPSKASDARPRLSGGRSGAEAKAARHERAERTEESGGERIAKRLARAGIASRRDAEQLIEAGRVTVNGRKLASPAFNVFPDDTIEVDGTPIPPIERTRLFLFHKPAGLVTTNRDPEGRSTVFDILPADLPRLVTVGRLDINTEGLLLMTNDGGLARILELPSTGWLRRYRARVHGHVEEKALAGLREGIAVDGVFYGSIEATLDREQGSNAWLTIGLREGKNREVKNILAALGLEVSRLIRISYGPFQLADLPEGHIQEIRGRLLREQLGERLIEESGANFEAPIVNQFPNRPMKKTSSPVEPEKPRVRRDGVRGRIDEGGLIRNRKRRENVRAEALDKLSTSPRRAADFDRSPRDDRRSGTDGEPKAKSGRTASGAPGRRERPPVEMPRGRKANVWMAPGARPLGAGKATADMAESEQRKKRQGKSFGNDRPRGAAGPRKPEHGGPAAKRDGRPGPRPAGAEGKAPWRKDGNRGPSRPPRGRGPGNGPRRK